MTATLARICRYPVKGLAAEPLDAVELAAGRCLPGDRAFALAHGASHWDPVTPVWRPKSDFVTLLRTERLAHLAAHYDPDAGTLAVSRDGRPVATGDPATPAGRAVLEQFFAAYLGADAHGSVHLAHAADVALTDTPTPFVSIINLASVRDLERVVGRPVDPLRFRGNLYVDGVEPWREFDWLDRELRIGGARLRVAERIGRCAATNVDPATARRDLNLPLALSRGYGHQDMGIYAEVAAGGRVAVGDDVSPA